jgi:hypothetical protein
MSAATLNKFNRLMCQTWSYDKLIRLGIYGSKVLVPLALRVQGPDSTLVPRLEAFSSVLSSYRVITRLTGMF